MTAAMRTITLAQARRVALAAQGFDRPRPERPVTMRDVQGQITRLGQFQIDSISIVERAHFMPLYSRLGPYDRALLERCSSRAPRRLFEYWGHAASLIDVTLWPAVQWRMERNALKGWRTWDRMADQHPHLSDQVLSEVAERGPLTARQIQMEEERRRDHWGWNWSSVKIALEHHFTTGQLTSAGRNAAFERLYDLPERVIPPAIHAQPALSHDDAVLALVRRAAAALGIASLLCLADYFRLGQASVRAAVRELEDSGELLPVTVAGWDRQTWLWHQARMPRRIDARALVSPFDSLVFERRRTEELFDFFYRIEIYVPEERRQHGYYVYPFLLGEDLVARVDLKADRAAGELQVRAAWLEQRSAPGVDHVAAELAEELALLAGWCGCSRVVVAPRGDLAGALARAVAARPAP